MIENDPDFPKMKRADFAPIKKTNPDDLIPTEKAMEIAKKIPKDANNPYYKDFDFDSFIDLGNDR